VNPHKVVARKNAFLAFSSARNEDELEDETKSRGLKLQCCPIATFVTKCNHLCNHSMHGNIKTRATNILCLHSSIVCNKNFLKKK
jgi:hypothetical protein